QDAFAVGLQHAPEPGALLGDPPVDQVDVGLGVDRDDPDLAEALDGLLVDGGAQGGLGGTVSHGGFLTQVVPVGGHGDELAREPQRQLVAGVRAGFAGGAEGHDPAAAGAVGEVPDPAGGRAPREAVGEAGDGGRRQDAVVVAADPRPGLPRRGEPGRESVPLAPGGQAGAFGGLLGGGADRLGPVGGGDEVL